MRKKVVAKAKKELERRFGKFSESMVEYYNHLDFRGFDDFTDETFFYLMKNVKGVNMLDLNETDITNESIALLAHLEYVNELRAKECRNLDNNCIADLNKLPSLVFLRLKSTSIDIDGLLGLSNLSNLKTLMFSANDVVAIKDKLLQLKIMLPQCELVINSKPYLFNAVDLFIKAIQGKPFSYRLKIKNEPLQVEWSNWLAMPSVSYIEAATQGPYRIGDIEWIDINATEEKIVGQLIAAKYVDHSSAIIKLLESFTFPYMVVDGIISVYLVQKEIF